MIDASAKYTTRHPALRMRKHHSASSAYMKKSSSRGPTRSSTSRRTSMKQPATASTSMVCPVSTPARQPESLVVAAGEAAVDGTPDQPDRRELPRDHVRRSVRGGVVNHDHFE